MEVNPGEKQLSSTENQNLKPPWKPGVSGNPAGRPKKTNAWSDVYNTILDSDKVEITLRSVDKAGGMLLKKIILRTQTDDGRQAPTIRYALACAVVAEGLKGNIKAIQELADRTVGKSVQSIVFNDYKPEETPLTDEQKSKIAAVLDGDSNDSSGIPK
jgi:hypothetical protein